MFFQPLTWKSGHSRSPFSLSHQSHRAAEVGSTSGDHLAQPLLEQGQPEQSWLCVSPGLCNMNISGQCNPVVDHFLSCLKGIFCISLCSCSLLAIHWASLRITFVWTIPARSASCSNPLTIFMALLWDFLQYVLVSLVLGRSTLDPTLQLCLPSAEQRGRIPSLDLLSTLPSTAQEIIVRLHCGGTLLFYGHLGVHWNTQGLSSSFPAGWSQLVLVHGIVPLQLQGFALPLHDHEVTAYFPSMSRSHWISAWPSGVSATPPSCVSSADLLRLHSVSSKVDSKEVSNVCMKESNCCTYKNKLDFYIR